MKMIKINVIFVHGINFQLSLKNFGKSAVGRNLPYPFLRGQPLNSFTHVHNNPSTFSRWKYSNVIISAELFGIGIL